ncbi:DUF1800 domain-containing protein [Pseudohalioglobus sediminis]|uniref:DUF1800 domain-containing protein n=1 Tax=Pseudohalioglobus sediminis TaxID=2606449 RepID=A0A5B0WRA1_9GAMM|nr:DUF1800 domain-containing protein [Pseudohalioglobus sediminis]KAA1189624.1 DUF1800 domain-containing protein [Pseudohalioglobus sediminis]
MHTIRFALLLSLVLGLAACGGGSSGGGSGAPPLPGPVPAPAPDPDPDPAPAPTPQLSGIEAAARLASRSTFGMNYAGIQEIHERGEAQWLEQQFRLPISRHDPLVAELMRRQSAGDFVELEERINQLQVVFRRLAWWQQSATAPDQLRQRVAYALSQIFVVSDGLNTLLAQPHALSNYYDTLLKHAFGNYRDLLLAVTLHPSMGVYLSHLGNALADPEANRYPDENYAREVMQLFSIGLYELNLDGTEKRDDRGRLIPTYDNDDIREFARVFTGLTFGDSEGPFWRREPNFRVPMEMFEAFHDRESKRLLRGQVIPAGQAGMQDIEDAVDNLFQHPNVGPFIGRQLIQRLVTSNPSPAYVQRVAEAFNGLDGGERGDMRAVLRAVLLDPEATALPEIDGAAGKLREPVLRLLAAVRQLNVSSPDGFFANAGYALQQRIGQHPLSAPSVFNFYLPNHSPLGDIGDAGLVAPEFQITNSTTVIAISNLLDEAVLSDNWNDLPLPPFQPARANLDEYLALADDTAALLDRLDLVMAYGTLSPATRDSIRASIDQIEDLEIRVRAAIYLVLISPDQAVEL